MKNSISLLIALISISFAQWTPVPHPGVFDQIELFLPSDDLLYAGTSSGKVFTSYDHGSTWTEIAGDSTIDYSPVESMILQDDYFLMSRFGFGEYNYRSYHNGSEWSPWEPITYQDDPIHSIVLISDTLFAILFGGEIHFSVDFGTSWTAVTAPGSENIWDIFTYDGHLFASNNQINDGMVYRSDDMGANWVEIGGGFGSSYICSHILWQSKLLLCAYHGGGSSKFWSSTNFGDTWEEITTLPTDNNINGLAISDGGHLAIGASGGHPEMASIWYTDDLITWVDYTGDLPQASWPFNELVSHDGWFFKSGGTVTKYRAPHPPGTSIGEETAGSELLSLTVHPNPLSGSTTFSFILDQASLIDLSVFDLTGRRVATVLSGSIRAGIHDILWDTGSESGQHLIDGIYLVQIRTDHGASDLKIILLD